MGLNDLLHRPAFSFSSFALMAGVILLWAMRTPPSSLVDDGEIPDRYLRGLIIRAVLGLVAVVAGAYAVVSDHVAWSMPLFASGFGLWLRLVRSNGRRRHESSGLRRIVNLADSALNASLLGGILIVGNLLAFKYGGMPIDMTRERSFSLSTTTLKQLAELDRPLTLTVFHNRGSQSIQQLDRVNQLLELYKSANSKLVKVELLDRFNEPDRYENLTKQVPDVALIPDGGVVFTYGEGESPDRMLVRNSDMFNLSASSSRPVGNEYISEFHGEDAITSALIRLREGKRSLIVFTTGHGETSANSDPRQPGVGIFRHRLEAVGSKLVDIDLNASQIDPETKLIIIIGPKSPFRPVEFVKLSAALEKNIPLLVLADASAKSGLEGFLKNYQVEIGAGVVVDPRSNYEGQSRLVIAQVGGPFRHPIVDPISNRRVLVPMAGPLRLMAPAPQVTIPLKVETILATGSESWAESNPQSLPPVLDPKDDSAGPVFVGVAISEPGKTARDPVKPKLVVFSSPYLIDNPFIEIAPTNLDLVMNAATWLRGRPDLIGITPKTHVALTLSVNPGMRARLVIVPTIMSVVVIIGLGVGTYLARRV